MILMVEFMTGLGKHDHMRSVEFVYEHKRVSLFTFNTVSMRYGSKIVPLGCVREIFVIP